MTARRVVLSVWLGMIMLVWSLSPAVVPGQRHCGAGPPDRCCWPCLAGSPVRPGWWSGAGASVVQPHHGLTTHGLPAQPLGWTERRSHAPGLARWASVFGVFAALPGGIRPDSGAVECPGPPQWVVARRRYRRRAPGHPVTLPAWRHRYRRVSDHHWCSSFVGFFAAFLLTTSHWSGLKTQDDWDEKDGSETR